MRNIAATVPDSSEDMSTAKSTGESLHTSSGKEVRAVITDYEQKRFILRAFNEATSREQNA
jgi:hypothetical protein